MNEKTSLRRQPVRFLHIPKTAGTSFNVFLDRFYPPESIFVFKASAPLAEGLALLRGLSPEQRRSIGLYRGHAPLVTGDEGADSARTFTLLREPVERVKSFCCHVAEGKSAELRHAFGPGNFELGRFLSSGHPELENLQTKMLVGESRYAELKKEGSADRFRGALQDAFDRIELVGVQSRYEQVLLVATIVFGWPATSPRKRLNVRSADNPVVFTREDELEIERLNRWDALAYEMACQRFDEVYRKHALRVALLRLRLRFRF